MNYHTWDVRKITIVHSSVEAHVDILVKQPVNVLQDERTVIKQIIYKGIKSILRKNFKQLRNWNSKHNNKVFLQNVFLWWTVVVP